MLTLDEISIINIVYFHVSLSKLVKQCFIELLSRMTKIWFLSALIQMNLIFIQKHSEKVCIGQFVVNEMHSYICLHIFPVLWHFEKIVPHP